MVHNPTNTVYNLYITYCKSDNSRASYIYILYEKLQSKEVLLSIKSGNEKRLIYGLNLRIRFLYKPHV